MLKQSDRIVAERSLDGTRGHSLRACRKPNTEWMKIHQILVDFPSSWSAVAAMIGRSRTNQAPQSPRATRRRLALRARRI
jgi:hypothetical protein